MVADSLASYGVSNQRKIMIWRDMAPSFCPCHIGKDINGWPYFRFSS
jgi:hypothetical protein